MLAGTKHHHKQLMLNNQYKQLLLPVHQTRQKDQPTHQQIIAEQGQCMDIMDNKKRELTFICIFRNFTIATVLHLITAENLL